MKFCSNCGTRLKFRQVVLEAKTLLALACEKCGSYVQVESSISKPEDFDSTRTPIKVVGEKEAKLKVMPTTVAECPRCGHKEAMWWLLQTRGGDEAATQFYRCTSCDHTWRQYT